MSHGPQFDEFGAQPGQPHNGAQHDAFSAQRADQTPHGALMDDGYRDQLAPDPLTVWDNTGWKSLPMMHGALLDENFSQPAALESGEHGRWMDVFRGGTQVRYLSHGQDVEGLVIRCEADVAHVQSRNGSVDEVLIGQIMGYRTDGPSRDGIKNAEGVNVTGTNGGGAPKVPASIAPSAYDPTASGGHLPGVGKSIDSSETALQAEPGGGGGVGVGHRNNCPKGGSGPCGAEKGGKCSRCNVSVRDHQAVGKSLTEVIDVLKGLSS